MKSTATMYWEAILHRPQGLAAAADWNIPFGQIPLADFIAAYQPLLESLRKEGVAPELLKQLALDPKSFEKILTGEKDQAIQEALRRRGEMLRDQIPQATYGRVTRFAPSGQVVAQVKAALVRNPGTSDGKTLPPGGGRVTTAPRPIAKPEVPLPAPRAKPTRLPLLPAQNIIDKIRREDKKLFEKIGYKITPQNLFSRLRDFVKSSHRSGPILSRKAVFYLIEGIMTNVWHSAGRAIENLIFERDSVFTKRHVQALQRLREETTHQDIQDFIRGLLDVLARRRIDLF